MGRVAKRPRENASPSRAAPLVIHTPPPEPTPIVEDAQSLGIDCVDEKQRERFHVLNRRNLYNTRFADDVAMGEIGVLNSVLQLFTNIGWQGLLKWDNVGYKRTTLEFLSSVRIQETELQFRLFNKPCALTMHQISNMIRAPTQDTFTPLTPTPP